ncbi:hypothetical protein AMTRI_Chr11g100710 [Amborella trichopoda]
MGNSVEEEMLVQMVHDFIESGSSDTHLDSPQENQHDHNQAIFTLQGILYCVSEVEREVGERVMRYVKQCGLEERCNLRRGLMMRLRMDGYDAAICRYSGSDCPGGFYEYLDITLEAKDKYGSRRLIIDTDFKSQFEIARPTPTYTKLSNSLPNVFVGNESKLKKIITLLCHASKQSLQERGLHIPPWRKTTYMQSKYLSPHQKITTISFTKFGIDTKLNKANGNGNASIISGKDKDGAKSSIFSSWTPPKVNPKRRDLGSGYQGAGLSSEFSNLRCPPVA